MILFTFSISILTASGAAPYVWSVGYAMECDYSPFRELPPDYRTHPPRSYLSPKEYIYDVKKGSVVWVQEHKLKEFYKTVLPSIKKRFVLVISDGDESFPSSYRKHFPVDKLIAHPKITHIFAQNVDESHPKVSHIPIGLDFHSMAQHSVEEQVAVIEEGLKSLLPTHLRKKRALVEFHLCNRGTYDGESRISIFHKIYPTGLIDALAERVPRNTLWAMKGEYAFSISPRGHGLDCHRTWEDLLLGCIVIVKTSPLDPLYKDLPVVIIRDWSEITEENFDIWLTQYGDAFTNPAYREKLTHAYWMNKIRSIK